MKYRFDVSGDRAVLVPPEKLYMPKTTKAGTPEYGFLTERNRNAVERLGIPELNSGFDTVYWYRGQEVTRILADAKGTYVDWKGQGEIPLTFVTEIPIEGNYMVKVSLYAGLDCPDALLFLGRRRLVWRGHLREGYWEGTFVTNICPIIPRTYEEPMEDLTLDVTVLGRGVHLVSVEVEPWKGRTLYIAGDSTVTDQSADYPYLPCQSYCGWGQMLAVFLGTQMAISNHAHSGLTTESFRSEGHYRILYERLQKGDICLIQFGHNDQKLMHLMAEDGYRENLIRYIEEIRKRGGVPVLVTPLARNSWRGDDGTYNDLLAPYAKACIRLADVYKVPLLDLHKKSMEFVTACGREHAMRYFFPGDYTHSNDYGAYRYAFYVYEEMIRAGLAEPGHTKEEWNPPEVLPELEIPKEYANIRNPADEHLFEQLERPGEDLTRVEALEMVIATMHFFPTNVYNDMFEDVIGHERYAGAVECAWQNGLIPEYMVSDHRFCPQKKITGEEFYQILKNGYKSRRTWTDTCEKILPEGLLMEHTIKRSVAANICRRIL